MSTEHKYVGRYAPSPTGDLHLGNLRTAMLAWLGARLQTGRFLLRMEDLDTPRTVKGSADRIIKDLIWLGLDWDEDVVFQSKRREHYRDALAQLQNMDLIYPCFCSRKDIQLAASAPHGSTPVYPGTCSNLTAEKVGLLKAEKRPSIRVRVPDLVTSFKDHCMGDVSQNLKQLVGDFVIKRADGLHAYQLAVVVDDFHQGVTDVVRGADLVESTVRQIYLSNCLNFTQMRYWHVPLMSDRSGVKMAKRDGSFSAKQWREKGKTAEQLVGFLAYSIGLVSTSSAISLIELLDSLTLTAFEQQVQQGTLN